MTRRVVLGSVALLAAFLAADASAKARGGLYGTVREGPTQPVCRVDEPCDRAAANLRLRFVRNGATVAAVRTDENGGYRITLRAGRYAVRLSRGGLGWVLKPTFVWVPVARYARVNFYRDTGIR